MNEYLNRRRGLLRKLASHQHPNTMSDRTGTTLFALLTGAAAGFLLWALTQPEEHPTTAARESDSPSEKDDLTRLKGIGPVIQDRLNEHGIYSFRQIAAWSDADIERIGEAISFPGRIQREDWQGQAREIVKAEG